MKKYLLEITLGLLIICIAGSAGATKVTITFDGFPTGGSSNYPYFIGNAYQVYGGVDIVFGNSQYNNENTNYFDIPTEDLFNQEYRGGWHVYGRDPNYPSISGDNTALDHPRYPDWELSPIYFPTPVSNVGAYFNAYFLEDGFHDLSAYDLNGTLLGSVEIVPTQQPTPGGPIYYELPYDDIAMITIGNPTWSFNLDNLQFTTSYVANPFPDTLLPSFQIEPVPEPATILLLVSGIVALAGTRIRK